MDDLLGLLKRARAQFEELGEVGCYPGDDIERDLDAAVARLERAEMYRVGEWDYEEDGVPIMTGDPGTTDEHMVAWVHGFGSRERALGVARDLCAHTGYDDES